MSESFMGDSDQIRQYDIVKDIVDETCTRQWSMGLQPFVDCHSAMYQRPFELIYAGNQNVKTFPSNNVA